MGEHEADEREADVSPATVWMVNRETGPDGWRGTINLEDEAVVFRPADGGRPREFPFEAMRRVRRLRASPVLEVCLEPTRDVRIVGFYFVQPPDLNPQQDVGKIMRKRRARMAAVGKLYRWNAVKKDEISGWVEAVQARRGAGSS